MTTRPSGSRVTWPALPNDRTNPPAPQVRSNGPVGVVYVASTSSSTIVPSAKLSVTTAFVGFDRLTTNVSSRSIRVSGVIGTSMNFSYSSGAKVRVPACAVKSSDPAVPPSVVR